MSCLFQLGDDVILYLLSWLGIDSIRTLDIAIGNAEERLLWLRSLHMIDSKAIDEYEHCHSSIRWLIMRGARVTRIRAKNLRYGSNQEITDQTIIGVDILPARNVNLVDGIFLSSSQINCETTNDVGVGVPVKKQLNSQLTAIDLSECMGITDAGVLAIAQNCPHLTSLDFSNNFLLSDIGLSAIAESCHHLTSIVLFNIWNLSDIGASAIAEGCHHLTSIDISFNRKVTDVGILAIAQGCPQLMFVNLSYCEQISEIGVQAMLQSCSNLTSMNLTYCNRFPTSKLSMLARRYPKLIVTATGHQF